MEPDLAAEESLVRAAPFSYDAALTEHMTQHPYQTLLVAAGIGYAVGGGVFTPLTARVVAMGLRAALVPLLQVSLVSAAQTWAAPASEPS
jgi:hypothetical protein